ncbi:MAG: deoxyribose-phosphate aldolase [Clostridiales bacterium]|jgi:deoxyribose-phosphate aldolase|nr:deoxyribose-phosphate aldolase [Clostridiales bacterium]
MDINQLIEEITREVMKELNNTADFGKSQSGYNAEYAKYIDHTVLRPETTKATVEKFCREAKEYGFASVCVNPTHVKYAAELLKGSNVKVCTVIGFPLGATTSFVKAAEVRDAIANGAQEVDMVINIGALKDRDYDLVANDIKAVVDAAAGRAKVKVIIETGLLTEQEKIKACLLAKSAGADFVKTCTGMNVGQATPEDIELMKKTVGPDMEVKASTGIKTREDADKLIRAGATRLGTSSGIAIVKGISPQLAEKSRY